jgi:Type II CAAX prenyl endopeptidase Rce1-like
VTVLFLWIGLSEEATYRLGVLTSLVYALRASILRGRSCALELPAHMAAARSPNSGPRVRIWRDPAFWAANLIQAYIFGAAHSLVRGGGVNFLRVLESPPTWSGVLLGFLYWRFGIEAAVLTHVLSNLAVIFLL